MNQAELTSEFFLIHKRKQREAKDPQDLGLNEDLVFFFMILSFVFFKEEEIVENKKKD